MKIENIATRVFKEEKENPAELINLKELKIKGKFDGAQKITLLALKSDYISNTGPWINT